MEQKMVANMSDQQVAFEAAERAVKTGEDWLNALLEKPDSAATGGSDGLYQDLEAGWWSASPDWSTLQREGMTAATQETSAPAYVAEEMITGSRRDHYGASQYGDTNTGVDFYRFTARGFGQRAATEAIIETTYARRF